MNKITLQLAKPIQAHGETLATLEFREPTGKDVAECGMPFSIETGAGGTQSQKIDTRAIAAYIVNLAGIPPSTMDHLSVADFLKATGIVVDFFGDAPAPAS